MNTSEIVKFNKRSGNDTERYINLSQSIQEGIFLVIQFKDEIKNFKHELIEFVDKKIDRNDCEIRDKFNR